MQYLVFPVGDLLRVEVYAIAQMKKSDRDHSYRESAWTMKVSRKKTPSGSYKLKISNVESVFLPPFMPAHHSKYRAV